MLCWKPLGLPAKQGVWGVTGDPLNQIEGYDMVKYIVKNVLMVIPTMLCVVFIIFTINYFTPGDPVAAFFDYDYTEEQYS